MMDDPQQAGPDAIEQNFGSTYNFLRVADKCSIKTEDSEFNAGLFWYHVTLAERGFFSPDFREGIEDYHADNYGYNTLGLVIEASVGRWGATLLQG